MLGVLDPRGELGDVPHLRRREREGLPGAGREGAESRGGKGRAAGSSESPARRQVLLPRRPSGERARGARLGPSFPPQIRPAASHEC